MPLTTPKLDDRHFQDIVDEAKKRIPHYIEEWTDHNVSDPGVTLIELFAWMTDIILYRLNRVPDLHYVKFMELLGIQLRQPVPAQVPVTFWLSAPRDEVMVIPAGTEVATTQTETEPSIVFTTDDNFRIVPPELEAIITRVAAAGGGAQKQYLDQNVRRAESGFEGFEAFSQVPQVNDAMYFGFKGEISQHILGFEMDCDPAGGAGIDPDLPPYIWEASTGDKDQRWEQCEVELDTTKGLNGPGNIHIHLPKMGKFSINKQSLYWVRARVKEISPSEERNGMLPYQVSPRVRQVTTASHGATIATTHARKVTDEMLGRSDGSAGQRYELAQTPVLQRQRGEHLIVHPEGSEPQVWQEVADFSGSGVGDRHYTLDSVTGEVRFGPAIRQQDGTMKLFGAIPPRGANIIFKKYRHGGGEQGNVQRRVINTLKTSMPYVTRIRNRQSAWGGLDAESLDSAKMRVPAVLRSRDRAVTESDFEFLARQAVPAGIGRVKCLQPRPAEAGRVPPGQIYLLVIPRVKNPNHFLSPDELQPAETDLQALDAFMDERRLLTTRLEVRAPAYMWVSCRVRLRATPGANQEAVEQEVVRRLYKFLNPLVGGPDGSGWPFGRQLFVGDVYQALQGVEDVMFIREVEMFPASPGGGPEGKAVESLEVLTHGVVASGVHAVEFV
ncbi:MAG: putative baseplate assembly protein [Candidatus Promineifilaceae bacterium]|nr:putative baseplate assembly protein [Candidatus Promineifilaceae bacterium]